jgi:small GTP-binding protein
MNKSNYFKVCLIGAPQTGKTTFLKRYFSDEFVINYWPSFWFDIKQFNFHTNEGDYQLMVWDLPGQEKYLVPQYYIGTSVALAFYRSETIDKTNQLIQSFKNSCPNVPIINVWSQSDRPEQLKLDEKIIKQDDRITYQISSLTNYNCKKLWIEILRLLTKNENITIL